MTMARAARTLSSPPRSPRAGDAPPRRIETASPEDCRAFEDALNESSAPRVDNSSQLLRQTGFMAAARTLDLAILYALAASGLAASVSGPFWGAPFYLAAPWFLAPAMVSYIFTLTGIYDFLKSSSLFAHLAKTSAGFALGGGLAALWIAFSGAPMRPVILTGGASAMALLAVHAALYLTAAHLRSSGALRTKVVIVGATPNARALIEANAETGDLDVIGVFDDRMDERTPSVIGDAPVIGTLEDMTSWARLPEARKIIITVTSHAETRVRQLVSRLDALPQRIALFLDVEGTDPRATTLSCLADSPIAYLSGGPDRRSAAVAKRAQDLAIGALGLLAVAPAMAVIALLIKLDSPGPVFFRQFRHGFNNSIIEVWKFRTMRPEEASRPTRQVEADDPRVTRIGRFLRKTSLDELPQLFNVLRGDMSLVGPRPHAIDMKTGDVESHRLVAEYAHRHRVKPGITGWAAVHGSRGPVHTPEAVRERVAYDIEYIERQNVWLDLWIMLMTVPCLLGDRLAPR
ncbi:exopolysaccharide biosynthesis polyprenyl glycosylphosphotransferase [Euryhalocaulis caribicus]|uniref:exopolysaccharide biosynthesis polyprenyl glycosylphosphotransferase n=1 Tax=Euryhalocaulis caribicus TaxID=1161401 RepID=UPI0003A786DC|nr:exopolysaccharide biosynthesis polyprenyl glycosylphosphotransferase [Euryhalocaulis caribicus]